LSQDAELAWIQGDSDGIHRARREGASLDDGIKPFDGMRQCLTRAGEGDTERGIGIMQDRIDENRQVDLLIDVGVEHADHLGFVQDTGPGQDTWAECREPERLAVAGNRTEILAAVAECRRLPSHLHVTGP
jgi:hypothetical protein